MKLRSNQEQAYNNIEKYGKAFIFWGRQIGKSYLLSQVIEDFAIKNKNADILYFSNQKNSISIHKTRCIKNLTKVIRIPNNHKRPKSEELFLINNNYLTFCSIKDYEHYILHLRPSLIVFDDYIINDFSNFNLLIHYLLYNNCKYVFTSYRVGLRLVKELDRNDCYINIIKDDEKSVNINDRDKLIITPDVLEYVVSKPDELIDYDNVIFKRRKKLKQLKLLSKEND